MNSPRRISESGVALLVTMNVIVLLSALAAAFLVVSYSENKEHVGAETNLKSFYIAEAGLNDAIADLTVGGTGAIASETSPRPFSGGGYYVTTASLGTGRWNAVATGSTDGQRVAIEAAIMDDVASAFYKSAAFGNVNLELIGSPTTDSYDSEAGSYLLQSGSTLLGRSYASPHGDVESNGDIYFGASAAIFGRAIPGAGKLLSVTGLNYVAGSTAPKTMATTMPPIMVPGALTSLAPTSIVSNAGSTQLNPGNYHFSSVALSSNALLEIQGPATLLIDDLAVADFASFRTVADNGPVYVYCTGKISVTGSAFIGSTRKAPWDMMVFATTDNASGFGPRTDGNPALPMSFGGSSSTFGVVYAPNGTVRGETNAQVHGSVVAKHVRIKDSARLHYDERLGTRGLPTGNGDLAGEWSSGGSGSGGGGPARTLKLMSWRRVAPGTVASGSPPSGSEPPPTAPPPSLPGRK